jgi:uncharacterized protein YciI
MTEADLRYFVFKLVSPRPQFPADMTDAERSVMAEHIAYWTGLRDAGTAVVFGPVGDPGGVWGLAVVEAGPDLDVEALRADDPVTREGLGHVEIHPMLAAVVRPRPRP